MLKGRHLLDPTDFSPGELDEIFDFADQIIQSPAQFNHLCDSSILATLFYEPSTRTRFSFEAAMLRLGGGVVGFSEPASSSVAKGESVADTIRTVACYADIIVMRHPKEGAPRIASQYSPVPVINAGDGGHLHPTQTLTDLLTIRSVRHQLTGLIIGCCGDLKFGRTVHSLIKATSRYPGNRFVLISPKELRVPDYVTADLAAKGIAYQEVERLDDVIGNLDILYMTRVQKERFFNEDDYVRLKDVYILNAEKMRLARGDMIVMHPLPRVGEISYDIDDDPRAYYFKQAKFGMYVRMALIAKLLGAS
ncbi:MAG: aspartate carbamoyltransferase [Caldiserica bacterium]|nr:aspartate carbamoyltransferase [Caldisericota bacterium]